MSGVKGFGSRAAQERRMKAARDRRDIDQKDVAKAVGASAATVSRWESGLVIPGDAMIEKLARYFGVTPSWLRYGQEPREPAEAVIGPKVARPNATGRRASGDGGQ